MRAKVASHANGHPYEKRFMDMNEIELLVSYRQAIRDEKDEVDKLKVVNEFWRDKADDLFKTLYIFTDRDLYKQYLDNQDLKGHKAEVPEDEFPEMWENLMEIIPEEVVVEGESDNVDPLKDFPDLDEKTQEFLVGFENKTNRKGEDTDENG